MAMKVSKENAKAIAKQWALGAGLAVIVFSADFTLNLDWGLWGPVIAAAAPSAFAWAKSMWKKFVGGEETPVE